MQLILRTFRVPVMLACLLACAVPRASQAQEPKRNDPPPKGPDVPDTPAARRLLEFVRVLNTGDATVVRRFHTADRFPDSALKKWPAEARTAFWVEQQYATGGILLDRVEKSARLEITALARGKVTEDWLRLSIDVEAEAPHRITGTGFFYIDPPADARPRGKVSEADAMKQLSAYLDKLAAADLF